MPPSFLKNRRTLFLFLMACCGHFIVDFSIGLWPIWKTIAGFPLVAAGVIAGASVLIGEACQLIFSLYADRGHWRVLIALGAFAASASLALPLSSSLEGAGLLFFITCIGSSAFHPTAAGLVSSIQGSSRPLLISIFHSSGLLGLAISQTVFTTLFEHHSHLPLALAALPCILACGIYLTPTEASTGKKIQEKISIALFGRFLRTPPLRKLYLLLVANQTMAWSFIFLMPDFLLERSASESLAYGGGHFIYILGAAAACVPLGLLANRINVPAVLFITYATSVAAISVTLLLPSSDSIVLSAFLFILGGSIGAIPPLALALGNEIETRHRAAVSAFLMGFVWIFAEGLGYGASSYIASYFQYEPATSALKIMSVALLFGIVQAYLLFQENPQQAPAMEK